ncbi:hypothetical protein IMX26_14335 [Clostridium sp. 'deep sea']|uniref:hypothetical protein n=1 Tax=Clostridium sp. 'deep sea' TaxID=2779445 RepID=UPI001896A008|nr:hypothetical protein [Clostridium sp. 'deep sea']QOR34636.1 hypothetical protein IMX26_14335 [Clostridium sp. 'deep sea']
MNKPKRKHNRLKNYDYSQAGYYFITICTKDKKNPFWKQSVGEPIGRQLSNLQLSKIGILVDKSINNITNNF